MKEIKITIKIDNETPRAIIIKAESKEEAELFFNALLKRGGVITTDYYFDDLNDDQILAGIKKSKIS